MGERLHGGYKSQTHTEGKAGYAIEIRWCLNLNICKWDEKFDWTADKIQKVHRLTIVCIVGRLGLCGSTKHVIPADEWAKNRIFEVFGFWPKSSESSRAGSASALQWII